jgi:hypothetical protein
MNANLKNNRRNEINSAIKLLFAQKNPYLFLQTHNINIDELIDELKVQIKEIRNMQQIQNNKIQGNVEMTLLKNRKLNSLYLVQEKLKILQNFKNMKSKIINGNFGNTNENNSNNNDNNNDNNNMTSNSTSSSNLILSKIINNINSINRGNLVVVNKTEHNNRLNKLYELIFNFLDYHPNKNYDVSSLFNLQEKNSFISYLKWCVQKKVDYNSIDSYINWNKELLPQVNHSSLNKLKTLNNFKIIEIFAPKQSRINEFERLGL